MGELAARYLPPGFKEIVAYLLMLVVLAAAARAVLYIATQEGLREAAVRILFKTSYLTTSACSSTRGTSFGLAHSGCLLTAPFLLPVFYLGELAQIFILAIAGVGLMLLIGFTGLVSLGHGAFIAVGPYTNTYLVTKGVPFLIAFPAAGLAALMAGMRHRRTCRPNVGHLPRHRHPRVLADRGAGYRPLGARNARASRASAVPPPTSLANR